MRGHIGFDEQQSRDDVAIAARAMSRLGYIHTFGHVSARVSNGILITPTSPPPGRQQSSDILLVDYEGNVLEGESGSRPIEVFLHLGIYSSRPDINAICRTHSPNASIWTRVKEQPPLYHGFGGFIDHIGHYDEFDLVHTIELGVAAANAMGSANALFLKGNGVLTAGSTVAEAAARAWGLEERCTYALALQGKADEIDEDEYRKRNRWYSAEMERVWTWLRSRTI